LGRNWYWWLIRIYIPAGSDYDHYIKTFKKKLISGEMQALNIGVTGAILFFLGYSVFEDLLTSPPVILTLMFLIGINEGMWRLNMRFVTGYRVAL